MHLIKITAMNIMQAAGLLVLLPCILDLGDHKFAGPDITCGIHTDFMLNIIQRENIPMQGFSLEND